MGACKTYKMSREEIDAMLQEEFGDKLKYAAEGSPRSRVRTYHIEQQPAPGRKKRKHAGGRALILKGEEKEVTALYKAGMSYSAIAGKFHCSWQTVRCLLDREGVVRKEVVTDDLH